MPPVELFLVGFCVALYSGYNCFLVLRSPSRNLARQILRSVLHILLSVGPLLCLIRPLKRPEITEVFQGSPTTFWWWLTVPMLAGTVLAGILMTGCLLVLSRLHLLSSQGES
jgi:hypothetical protein